MTSPAPKVNEQIEKPAERSIQVHTYHCLCTQVILATTTKLDSLTCRSSDKSYICHLPAPGQSSAFATLTNTIFDNKPTVIRLEDGFEKRYFAKCARCSLITGYHLDKGQFEKTKGQAGCAGELIYLLPGGLMSTEEMVAGKKMDEEIAKIAVKA